MPENPLVSKDIKTVNVKGDQPWIFTGRTNAVAEAPGFWSFDVTRWLCGKVPDPGKDRGQNEKRVSEGEMAGCHHRCNAYEPEQSRGDAGTGKLGVLQSMWSNRVRHDWVIGWLEDNNLSLSLSLSLYIYIYIYIDTYIYRYRYIYTHRYIYIYIYLYTHTHIYIKFQSVFLSFFNCLGSGLTSPEKQRTLLSSWRWRTCLALNKGSVVLFVGCLGIYRLCVCVPMHTHTHMHALVVSHSLWPRGLQPASLLCPWIF